MRAQELSPSLLQLLLRRFRQVRSYWHLDGWRAQKSNVSYDVIQHQRIRYDMSHVLDHVLRNFPLPSQHIHGFGVRSFAGDIVA